jgi:hypothetical protein
MVAGGLSARAAADAMTLTTARAALLTAARATVAATLLAVLAACASTGPRGADQAPAPPSTPQPLDASYDWHGLLAAPMGSALKEVPVNLHEVLLFRDESRGVVAPDDPECYASDAAAPRFVGRAPEEYLLCFKRDHLSRIQASVKLTAAEAPEVFAAACALWLKNAAAPGTAASGTAASGGGVCEGRDGAVHFSGQMTDSSGRVTVRGGQVTDHRSQTSEQPEEAGMLLSIVLDGSADAQ